MALEYILKAITTNILALRSLLELEIVLTLQEIHKEGRTLTIFEHNKFDLFIEPLKSFVFTVKLKVSEWFEPLKNIYL